MKNYIKNFAKLASMIGIVFLFNYFTNQSTKLSQDFVQDLDNINGTLIVGPTFDEESYIKLLTGTKLDIQVYDLTSPDFINLIIEFRKNLGTVRLMLEDNMYKGNNNYPKIVNKLFKYGVKIQNDSNIRSNYLHSKLLLTDFNFIIQSGNLGYSTFFRNREHFFVSENKEILNNLNELFDKDWNGQKIKSNEIHPNLIVCNINCREKIEYLLNNAQSSIYIETQYITDSSILGILESKNHLDLKIIVGKGQDENYFKGLEINNNKRIYSKYYLHTKTILVDNKYLIVGSMNLSDNSLDKNREHGIILINKSLIEQYKKEFMKDWDLVK
ncbi:MAG: phospholipase D-like domain-containing protein [Candidatus Absconditabacteria bacterium]